MYRLTSSFPCAALAPILWCIGATAGTSIHPVATVADAKDGTCMVRESKTAQPRPLHKDDPLAATDLVQCEANHPAQGKYIETGGVFTMSGTWHYVGNPGPRPPSPDKPQLPAATRPAFNMPPKEENPNRALLADSSEFLAAKSEPNFKTGFNSKEESEEGLKAKFASEVDAALARIHPEPGKTTSKDVQEVLLVYPVDNKASIALYKNPGDKQPYAWLPPGKAPLISNNKPTENGFWGVEVGGKDAWVDAKSVQVQRAGPVTGWHGPFGCGPGGRLDTCN